MAFLDEPRTSRLTMAETPPPQAPAQNQPPPATPLLDRFLGTLPSRQQPQPAPQQASLLDSFLGAVGRLNPVGSAQAAEAPAAPVERGFVKGEGQLDPALGATRLSVPGPPVGTAPAAPAQAGDRKATVTQAPPEPAPQPGGGSLLDKFLSMIPNISRMTGMPSAMEQIQAAGERETPHQPGTPAGRMMPPNPLENPAVQVLGAAGLGRGPGIRTPGYQQRTTPLPPGQMPGAADLVRGAGHAIETTFSPTTVDSTAGAAEALIDRGLGHARRETAVANATMKQFRHQTAPLQAPYQQYVHDVQAHAAQGLPTSHLPKPGALQLIDYMEGRSTGAALPPDLAHLQPLANTLRKLYQERAAAIAADPVTNVQHFFDDYFSHQWKERPTSSTFQHGGHPRMGSGGPLKRRTIPTVSEGIEAGLTPTSWDPIETSMRYIANMDRFLASNEIFAAAEGAGMIKRYHPGQAPPGWARLQGRLAGPTPGMMEAYAPEGFARVYNRSAHVDPGWAGSTAYEAANRLKNATTQLLLSLSGYHYLAMTQEAAVSKLAQALGSLSDRDLAAAFKAAGLAPTAVVTQAARGARLKQSYLRQVSDPRYDAIADLAEKAGARLVGKGQEWRGSAMEDYWTAYRRGTLAGELRTGARDVAHGPVSTSPLRAGALFFREVGRLMETVNKPLFDHLVPNLKGAAFMDEMELFLKGNPAAGTVEQIAKARQVWDAIDDRFGEMVMDRVFWNQKLKQSLQLAMVSPGWELGSVRSMAGGAGDLDRFRWTPRARWLISFPITVALTDGVYQYLRTGKAPENVGQAFAPQTGGTTPEGTPERAILPGYEKDPLGWYHDPLAKITGMANPAAKLPYEAFTGKDAFTGQPIVEDYPGAPGWLKQWAGHILKSFEPIPLQQMQKQLPGTALGWRSNLAGIRPAPGWLTDPARAKKLEDLHKLNETTRSLQTQRYQASRRDDPAEVNRLDQAIRAAKRKHEEVSPSQRGMPKLRKAPGS